MTIVDPVVAGRLGAEHPLTAHLSDEWGGWYRAHMGPGTRVNPAAPVAASA